MIDRFIYTILMRLPALAVTLASTLALATIPALCSANDQFSASISLSVYIAPGQQQALDGTCEGIPEAPFLCREPQTEYLVQQQGDNLHITVSPI